MATLINNGFDSGLSYIDTNGTRLDICSSEPTTYGQATTGGAVSLGSATVNTGAPADGGVDGRQVTIPAISNGTVSNTGLATHWALTNGTDTLIATGTLSASQTVTATNTFTLDAIVINFRDPTEV